MRSRHICIRKWRRTSYGHQTAHRLEGQVWADRIVAQPSELKNGHLIVLHWPGDGLAWNEDAVRRYRDDI